jgi:hypothetical protein
MPAVVCFLRFTLVSNNSAYRVDGDSQAIEVPAFCQRISVSVSARKIAGPSKLRVCDTMPVRRAHVSSAFWRVLFLYRLEVTSIVCFVWITAIFNRFGVPIRMVGRNARMAAEIAGRRGRGWPNLGLPTDKWYGPALYRPCPFGLSG